MCEPVRHPLAEGVHIHDYYEGKQVVSRGHICPQCEFKHPCDVISHPFSRDYKTGLHHIICSRDGQHINVGQGSYEDGIVVIRDNLGHVLNDYPMYADNWGGIL